MTEDELITRVTREMMDLASKFDSDNFADAVDEAESETGFTCPVTSTFQIRWLRLRTKRALLFMLLTGAAKNVRYENLNREQAFGNYRKIIKDMDDEFNQAQKDNVYNFLGVPDAHMFGTKIDAGFQYEPVTGADTTYTDDNKILIGGTEGTGPATGASVDAIADTGTTVERTIANGSITAAEGERHIQLIGEGNVADVLVGIAGGSAGQVITLWRKPGLGYDIVISSDAELHLQSDSPFTINTDEDNITLVWREDGVWTETGGRVSAE